MTTHNPDACDECRRFGWADPLTIPEPDLSLIDTQTEWEPPRDRETSRLVVLVCIAAMCLIALYLGSGK